MSKIKMINPLVEMDGDEMTRVIWSIIKEELLEPFIELKTEYYDLGLKHRNETDDRVTVEAAKAIRKYGVGVKCATITPNKDRVKEYNLKEMWKSPNGTIRAILDGTVFRSPIIIESIKPYIRTWQQPITIARHAYGDIYKDVEMKITGSGKAKLVFEDNNGEVSEELIHDFHEKGIVMAIDTKQDLWFSAKDTISKKYDHTFKDIFAEIYEKEYKERFNSLGIEYFYTLIDDAVARVIKSKGGFIWALKNYDGDVMSDMIATAFGSLAMMTSVLVSPEGYYEYEAAHGTVQRHYYNYLKGISTSTNSIATIFAWSGALRKRGEMDGLKELVTFAHNLEKASIDTINDGVMTKDLALLTDLKDVKVTDTEGFIKAIRERLEKLL